MNRLQKKCVIVSAGLHLLLVAILFIGPAFLSSPTKSEDLPIVDFIPSRLVDAAVVGGGNPRARPPAAAPAPAPALAAPAPAPAPAPEPVKPREPETPKVVEREIKRTEIDPESLETAKDTKPRKPEVHLTKVTRKSPQKTSSKTPVDNTAETEAAERRATDTRRRAAANALSRAAANVREGTSSATTIEEGEYGPGGGGPAYASYAAWVKTIYDNAWVAPEDTVSDDAVAKVSVTIARDGTVVSARISKASGDSPVDRSVQRTLDRVKFIAPFPEGAKDRERTYIINFNLKAKRGLA